jgi:hypothetical protein
MECFLRRHGASWKLACSERLAGSCDCRGPHPECCPFCGPDGKPWDEEGLAIVKRQMDVERKILGERARFVVVKSPHFLVVTDIPRLKVLTRGKPPRIMEMHEIAHLFAQRAEIAYRDFVAVFGDRVILPRPSAVYLLDSEATKQELATRYFGLPLPELFYGGDIDRIGGGYPWNGCALSRQKYGEDEWLHFQMRHLIGHLLVSCWVKVTGNNRYLPRWMYEGTGHWLSRLPEKFREMANFCTGEGSELSHSGKKWPEKCVVFATSPKAHPIQRILDVEDLGGLDLEMNIRAWSWFDLGLSEDRERFVSFLAELREGTEVRAAMRKTLGVTPEEFEARWRDRILGKRISLAPTPAELDAAAPEDSGAKERAAIRAETDPGLLASRIRGLGAVEDALTAATIVPFLAHPSEAVRETVVAGLGRSKSAEVTRWLAEHGLPESSGLARAGVARVLGDLAAAAAAPALLAVAADGHWLVRAHVARALGILALDSSLPVLVRRADDPVGRVRVAVLDALARFGPRAASAAGAAEDALGDGAWQVRSAAAGCLGELGEMRSVEPLIARMEIEAGRVREDIHAALRKITRDDLGRDPEHWRKWFEKEKARRGGALPPRPAEPPPPRGDIEYGEEPPTYYGLRVFSRTVGYVIDTSGSMAYQVRIDPAWLAKSGRAWSGEGSKYEIATREAEASLRSLDPRARIGLVFFRTAARRWERGLVPATPGNVSSAISRLAAEAPPSGGAGPAWRTNYVDAFRLVFEDKGGAEPPAPFADTPDTVFFLTDGKPTEGEIIDPDLCLSWIAEKNRFAKIVLHVISIGNTDVDPAVLERLAAENGGVFVRVPEAH